MRTLVRKPWFWLAVVLLAFLTISFSRAMYFGFVWDDIHLFNRPDSQFNRDPISALTITQADLLAKSKLANDSYRPVQFISYWLDFRFFDRSALGMHLHNILLFWILSGLVFLISYRFFSDGHLALMAFALFSTHPLLVESVTYIAARSDLIVAIFCLLGLTAILKTKSLQSVDHVSGSKEVLEYVLIGCLFLLALLSKENAVGYPLVALSLAWAHGTQRLLRLSLAFLAGLGVYLFVRFMFVKSYGNLQASEFVYAGSIWTEYVRILLFPLDNSITRPIRISLSLGWAALLITIASILWGIQRRKLCRVPLILGLSVTLSILGFCLPAIRYIVGQSTLADRYMIMPLFCFSLLLTSLGVYMHRTVFRRLWLSGIVVFIAINAALSWNLVPVWENQVTLFEHNLKMNPDNGFAHYYASTIYAGLGRCDEAAPLLKSAVALNPSLSIAYYQMGSCLLFQKRYQEAIDFFQKTLNQDLLLVPPDEVFVELARAFAGLGDIFNVCRSLDEALSWNSTYQEAILLRRTYCSREPSVAHPQ